MLVLCLCVHFLFYFDSAMSYVSVSTFASPCLVMSNESCCVSLFSFPDGSFVYMSPLFSPACCWFVCVVSPCLRLRFQVSFVVFSVEVILASAQAISTALHRFNKAHSLHSSVGILGPLLNSTWLAPLAVT